MKEILKKFKNLLIESDLLGYTSGGMITVYHYSKSPEKELVLNPKYFISNTSYHSRREKETSTVPRVFFYTDPNKTEAIIARDPSRKLFSTQVPASKVYNIAKDPEGFIKKVRHPVFGLRKGMEWNDLLNSIKEKYDGVFYSIGTPDVIAWFRPIKVYRTEEG